MLRQAWRPFNAVASSEERTLAETKSSRLPHREVADGFPPFTSPSKAGRSNPSDEATHLVSSSRFVVGRA